MALKDIRENRLDKRSRLKKANVDPYPIYLRRTHTIAEVQADFKKLLDAAGEVVIVGRIMTFREHGGSTFSDIRDGTGNFQIYAKKDALGEEAYSEFLEYFDIGDFVEARGILFTTKMGQESLEIRSIKMLSKSLLPLPEKWHGLQDVEERYRKRYLDILMNKDVKKIFETRSAIVSATREFLIKNGFIEVETSILQPIPGGGYGKAL